ncbi:MAG: hypothetical protein WBD20_07565 [Pirellulaceae bacterium]
MTRFLETQPNEQPFCLSINFDAVLIENFFLQEFHSAGVKKHPDFSWLNAEIINGDRPYRSRDVRTVRYKYLHSHEHNAMVEELYAKAIE